MTHPPADPATRLEHFRQIAEAVDEVFFITHPDYSRMEYISPGYEQIWGRSRDSLVKDPLSFLEAIHTDDRGWVRKSLLGQAEGARDEHFRVVRPDGTVRWVHTRSYPIRNEAGEVVRIAGVARDVTRLKETEDALRRSRAEFREVLERVPVGVAIYGTGGLVYANVRAAGYLGFEDATEMWGMDIIHDFVHPDERDAARERVERQARTGSPEPPREYRMRHRDGHWVSLQIAPLRVIHFEGRPASLMLVTDVTPQRRIEAALRESEERYRTVFEAAAVGMLLMSPDGTVVEANPAVQALLGLDRFEPGSVRGLDLVHWEDVTVGRALFKAVTREDDGRHDRELRLLRADGSHIWAHVHVTAVRDEAGEITALVGLVEDIRERKGLEEQLRVVQRIESIGRLAGGMAHDFNNLITVIDGHAAMLSAALEENDRLAGDVKAIRQAADRAASLTRQLLAFSRRQVLQPRIVDLNRVVQGVEGMLRRLLGEDVDLVVGLVEEPGTVEADPAQIEQVLLNLAVNARDAMPLGGRLTIRTRTVELDAGFTRNHPGSNQGPHVCLEVEDTGEGIDEEHLPLIFEPFFTTKEPGKGTGLGLAMSYGIVKQSGGYILAESSPREGSTFSIFLPRVEGPPDEEKEVQREPMPGSETILVAEDEPTVRQLTERILVRQGYRVITASDGVEALSRAEEEEGPIHLLLTDVVMPNMGGRELAEAVTRQRPDTRVLFMSGYTDDAVVRHGVTDQKKPFLQKPFTFDELGGKVREVLDRE